MVFGSNVQTACLTEGKRRREGQHHTNGLTCLTNRIVRPGHAERPRVPEERPASPSVSSGTPIIGLAGGIGSGKSLVAGILGDLGALVLDADQSAQEILDRPDVLGTLVSWWGSEVRDEAGQADRRRIAEIVFDDPQQRRRLEALIHPRIFAAWQEVLRQCQADPAKAPAVVIDAPLLFEAGLDSWCDVILFVEAPESDRARRVQANRGWTQDELERREKTQESLDAKRAASDHVIRNTSSVTDLRRRVEAVFSEIAFADT